MSRNSGICLLANKRGTVTNKYPLMQALNKYHKLNQILDEMNIEAGTPLHSLKVDGGLTVSDICLQIQADLVGIPVVRPEMTETTSLGAALAAGLAVGVWKDLSEFQPDGATTVFECKILSEGKTAYMPTKL